MESERIAEIARQEEERLRLEQLEAERVTEEACEEELRIADESRIAAEEAERLRLE